MSNLIDGKLVASDIKARVAERVEELKDKDINVCLAVIMVGNDPASQVYVNNKKKACEELGIISRQFCLAEDFGQEKLLSLIETLNKDAAVNGILCQLPLPEGYDERAILEAIDPIKDVDSFQPLNMGKLMLNDFNFLPCTPSGVMEMLRYYDISVEVKECVVIGRSIIVGKPMAMLLLNDGGTVTVAHSKTTNLEEVCRRADILVSAVGKPKFVTAEMVKEGAIVIDIGINKDAEGKLCGDVDFENVKDKCSLITPVPGGVGPMTIAMLMQNTLIATLYQNRNNS